VRSRSFAAVAAFLLCLVWGSFARAEGSPAKIVDLYTMGAGSYLFSRYGHSLLCVRDAPDAGGRCYDYGVPDRDEAGHMAWASVRAEPIFVAVAIDEEVVLDVFRGQGRAIERQRLPLSADEAARLAAALERDVRERRAYAYHPYFANCTTQVRDRLDEATGGRLRPGKKEAPTLRFRDMAEEGLSGRLVELTALAFLLGGPSERRPTAWEAMFLPEGLRDGVAERFGAAPERVEERKAVILPTSRAVGRLALVVLALALSVFGGWALRKKPRLGLGVIGAVLGGMALVADLVAALVVWPEFRRNAALFVLLPSDLLLPFVPAGWLRRYALARVGIAVAMAVLEMGGVVAQPILTVSLLVALPMGTIASVMRERARVARSAPPLPTAS
jgi:hypothetical protein